MTKKLLECFMKKICFILSLMLIPSLLIGTVPKGTDEQDSVLEVFSFENDTHALDIMSANPQGKKSLLILGDSISTGYGLEGYPDSDDIPSYGNLFAEYLGAQKNESYFNRALDGETSSGLLWRINNSDKGLYSDFDAIVISSGGNDLLDSLLPSVISLFSEFGGAFLSYALQQYRCWLIIRILGNELSLNRRLYKLLS